MKDEQTRGLLVVGHGSRREEANSDVREAARLIGERGGFRNVEAAFLEIEQPDIKAAFSRLVERGARSVVVHPYFLSPGRHTRGDLPRKVAEAAASHPGIEYVITEPLAAHDLVIAASVQRIREVDASRTIGLSSAANDSGSVGIVYLVGAGPGDPGLLTVRGRQLLQTSDTVIYDYLVNPEILELASPEAEQIYVGKIGHCSQVSQSEINQLLIENARNGKTVVRLKGGDPFLFGRGGEEALALREAGIEFEIVPGISSAMAVAAYAGIPLTHRGLSSSVSIQAGHLADEKSDGTDGFRPEAGADTLVILMGVSRLSEIARKLIASGRLGDTPAAVIRWGTYDHQQIITGSLRDIAGKVEDAGLRPPAVIVVGEVVKLRESLRWFETELVKIAPNNLEAAARVF